jgi:hypothetical protein
MKPKLRKLAVAVVWLSAVAFWCELAIRAAADSLGLYSYEVRVLWVRGESPPMRPAHFGRVQVGGELGLPDGPNWPGTDRPLPVLGGSRGQIPSRPR